MRRPAGRVGVALGAVGFAACCAIPLAGCSSPAHATGTNCGTARTAAGVPVVIKVAKGNVGCGAALDVESKYATMIRTGQVPGNGGGAPVKVSGWTCQGYPTPEVLRTGDASECHAGSAEILAVLPSPASPGSAPTTASTAS